MSEEDVSVVRNRTDPGHVGRALGSSARPAWAIAVLASVLIFTTVVDVLGNLLVIISVFRNRKLRNAGEKRVFLQERMRGVEKLL